MKKIILITLLAFVLVGCASAPDTETHEQSNVVPNIQLITDFEIIYSEPYHYTIYRWFDLEYNVVCYSFTNGISCVPLED